MKMIITADHYLLLERMTFDWDDECEWGAVSSDCKRPFGNSGVERDVAEILGREVDYAEAKRLTVELSAIVHAAVFRLASGRDIDLSVGSTHDLPRRAARLLGGGR